MNRKHIHYNALELTTMSMETTRAKLSGLRQLRDQTLSRIADTEKLCQEMGISSPELAAHLKKMRAQVDRANNGIAQIEASISITAEQIIRKLGDSFEAQFDDCIKTRFAVVTAAGLESFLSPAEIIAAVNDPANGGPNTSKTYDEYSGSNQTGIIKNGYLVNMDLFQQVALLAAIEQKISITNKIGFYNFNGGACVHKTPAAELWKKKKIGGFRTGEKCEDSSKSTHRKSGMVYLNDQELLAELKKESRFYIRRTSSRDYAYGNPNAYDRACALVLGLIIEEPGATP